MLCRVPQVDGSWWRVLTKCDPLEKGMANHLSILALRTPWTVWKGKKWEFREAQMWEPIQEANYSQYSIYRERARISQVPVCGQLFSYDSSNNIFHCTHIPRTLPFSRQEVKSVIDIESRLVVATVGDGEEWIQNLRLANANYYI